MVVLMAQRCLLMANSAQPEGLGRIPMPSTQLGGACGSPYSLRSCLIKN